MDFTRREFDRANEETRLLHFDLTAEVLQSHDEFLFALQKFDRLLEMFSQAYAWIIFAGFSIVPVGVLAQKYEIFTLFASAR